MPVDAQQLINDRDLLLVSLKEAVRLILVIMPDSTAAAVCQEIIEITEKHKHDAPVVKSVDAERSGM